MRLLESILYWFIDEQDINVNYLPFKFIKSKIYLHTSYFKFSFIILIFNILQFSKLNL